MANEGDESPQGGSLGPSTDRHNEPVIDPTRNVLNLVEAAIKRQDDLRLAAGDHITEVLRLRGEQRENDFSHLTQIVNLRAEYDQALRDAEAKRIDAIRAVDVGAVQRAAEVSAAQAATLATQVATSAEALRLQVQAAAGAASTALAAALDPIQKDIADLRRAQYEAQGQKTQVVEQRSGSGAVVAYIAGAVAALVGVTSLILLFTQNAP